MPTTTRRNRGGAKSGRDMAALLSDFGHDLPTIPTLAPEAKHLTDTIKMVAYRAETALVRCLAPHYAKTEDEGRALIREMLSSNADIVPEGQRLRIRLHSLANPRSNQALAHVCATLNALELQYQERR